jgi:hypothetical protein
MFTDPRFGSSPSNEGGYLPALLVPVGFLYLCTIAVTLGLGVVSCLTSFKTRRWGWLSAFVVLTLLCLLGPVVLYVSLYSQTPTSVGTPTWNFIAFLLASGPLLMLVVTLFYLRLRPALD